LGEVRARIDPYGLEDLMFYMAARYLREAGWKDWDVLQIKGRAWLIFRPGREGLSAVGKFRRLPTEREEARRECDALERLAPFADELSVPRLLCRQDTPQGFFYLQSFLPGKPLRRELSVTDGKRTAKQFELVEEWLGRFQSLLPCSKTLPEVFQERVATAAVEGLPPILLESAAQAVSLVPPVPAVAVHGDFFGGNILAANGRLSVVDWSTFHFGAPMEDLFTFGTGAAFRSASPPEASVRLFGEIFYGSSALARQTRAAALRALARANLSENLLGSLFLMYLLDRLARGSFVDVGIWREFLVGYIAAGIPAPWSGPICDKEVGRHGA
jgi:hypothetical protein